MVGHQLTLDVSDFAIRKKLASAVRQMLSLKFDLDAEKPTRAATNQATRWRVKIVIDAQPVVFYYRHNTGKEVI